MDNQYVQVLDAICDKLGIAVDWSSQNIVPQIQDVLTRYGKYLFGVSTAQVVISSIMIITAIILLFLVIASYNKRGWAYDKSCGCVSGTAGALIGLMVTFSMIGIPVFCVGLNGLIKSITIPDIYAAQKIIEMLQG